MMIFWQIVFGAVLAGLLCGWVVLFLRWGSEARHLRALLAILITTMPVLLANAIYAQFRIVMPSSPGDYSAERWRFLLSAAAAVAAFRSVECTQNWIVRLTLPISLLMLAFYALAGMTV